MNEKHEPFRILSLDGGGARGWLSARILEKLEHHLGQCALGQTFDLIVGTSTGAILAAGLAVGCSARELQGMYDRHLRDIFRPSLGRGWLGPEYSSQPLRRALTEVLGKKTLADVQTRLCVVSVDAQTARPRLHKSDYFSRNRSRLTESLVDVVLASAAAPTYFPMATDLENSGYLVDGGLCANNPAMVALTDALQIQAAGRTSQTPSAHDMDAVVMLSVGTGRLPGLPFDAGRLKHAGKLRWMGPGAPLMELLFASQSLLAHYQAQFLLGERYLRIDPVLPRSVKLDDVKALPSLGSVTDLDKAHCDWVDRYLKSGGH